MIHLDRLAKSFRRNGVTRRILEEVTMTLPQIPGLALLGRNGAGKSTLLRLIAGTMTPDQGRIITDEAISWPMGFAGGFHPALTGAQNTRFVARIHGRNPRRMADAVQDFAELGDAWTMPFSTYSTGMKSRLAFAVSIAVEFDTYLVDEIIGVGDAAFRQKCQRAFRARMDRSRLIMIAHNPDTLRQFCHSGLVLERGRLIFVPDIEEAIEMHEANLQPPVPAPA